MWRRRSRTRPGAVDARPVSPGTPGGDTLAVVAPPVSAHRATSILVALGGATVAVFGLAALVQVSATMPGNYIAFELPSGSPEWWYDIVEGLPEPLVVDGFIHVWDRPGIGIEFRIPEAKRYLGDEDRDFFDN